MKGNIKSKNKIALLLCAIAVSQSACSFEPPEITNPVHWYAVNGWTSPVTFQVRDRVCNRQLPKITLGIREEIRITSCGDENNRARIRYRRDSYQMAWSTGVASVGQRLQMQ